MRYLPSGTYFLRARVEGMLHRKSPKTKVRSVAKQRLRDESRSSKRMPNRCRL